MVKSLEETSFTPINYHSKCFQRYLEGVKEKSRFYRERSKIDYTKLSLTFDI